MDSTHIGEELKAAVFHEMIWLEIKDPETTHPELMFLTWVNTMHEIFSSYALARQLRDGTLPRKQLSFIVFRAAQTASKTLKLEPSNEKAFIYNLFHKVNRLFEESGVFPENNVMAGVATWILSKYAVERGHPLYERNLEQACNTIFQQITNASKAGLS